MPLTPDQIKRIRNREPGWESDWGQLYMELQARLDRIVPGLDIDWPRCPQVEMEEFIAKMMADYERRAYNGTLLVLYDGAQGTDVVQFLASKRIVRRRALTYVMRILVRTSLSFPEGDDGEGRCWEPEAPAPYTDLGFDCGFDCERVMRLAEADLVSALSKPGYKITQNLKMAAIQLWPWLDSSRPELEPLRRETLKWILGREQTLIKLHEEARTKFEKQIDEISVERYNGGRGVAPDKERELEARKIKLEAQMLFCPLEAQALMQLFNVSEQERNSVIDKPLSRYYKARRTLFPTLYKLVERIESALG